MIVPIINIMNGTDTYRLEAAIALAEAFPGRLTASEIARRRRIPEKFLARLLATLARGGVVVTTRGPRGGARLARPAEHISLAQILDPGPERPGGGPAVQAVARRLAQSRRHALESLTLAALLEMEREVAAELVYEI